MKFKTTFLKAMNEQNEMALASSMDNVPNVRIVNFYYDEEKKVVLFTTFKGSKKIKEFNSNDTVAFTTIPVGSSEHVKVNSAKVKQSDLSVADVKAQIIKKMPDMEEMITYGGDQLCLYEITFNEATVIIDHNQIEQIVI